MAQSSYPCCFLGLWCSLLGAAGAESARANATLAAPEALPTLPLRRNQTLRGSPVLDLVTQFEGVALPILDFGSTGASGVSGSEEVHVFAVGDWGTLLPGHFPAPNVRPTGSDNLCPDKCDYVHGIDDKAQLLVAEQMKRRAASSNPQYVLNVGDNFYWGGITETCGLGTWQASAKTIAEFAQVWKSVYGSLTSKPWISALGNHDYGGWQFNMGWDQQIAYSFTDSNWVMPARYFSKQMLHPGFSVEYFVIDSNAFDAMSPDEDPRHNICSSEHNPVGATCESIGGPSSPEGCAKWFWDSYRVQQAWLEKKLAASTADWQVVVTHFPCGHDARWYAKLHQQFGLDLLVTGHRHNQELWDHSGTLGGLTCIVTGGGGGVTSEAAPKGDMSSQYGFFDLTLSKSAIQVELVNFNGFVLQSATVRRKSDAAPSPALVGSCAAWGCRSYDPSRSCQCNAECSKHGSCCADYADRCLR